MRRHSITAVALLAALADCGSSRAPEDLAGWQVEPAAPKPDFTLTATDGARFAFRRETAGFVVLLFFGYTRCPDVCPVHMANIAAALHRLDPLIARRIRVVFVTTDPARDSLPALRHWLDHFDERFVGLRGSVEEINRIQLALGQGGAFQERGEGAVDDTTYTVGHGAVVFAFTADDSLRVRYPFGVRQADWAWDLPRLVAWVPREGP